jgi:hypothetical protein
VSLLQVMAVMFELGCIFHSVIIGIGLGVMTGNRTAVSRGGSGFSLDSKLTEYLSHHRHWAGRDDWEPHSGEYLQLVWYLSG